MTVKDPFLRLEEIRARRLHDVILLEVLFIVDCWQHVSRSDLNLALQVWQTGFYSAEVGLGVASLLRCAYFVDIVSVEFNEVLGVVIFRCVSIS